MGFAGTFARDVAYVVRTETGVSMLTSKELLAAVRDAQGIPSNYRLARVLDVPEKSVQRWNTNKNTPDDAMTIRLAELAGMDPGTALASMYAQRAAATPLARVWESIAKRAEAAPAVVVAAILSGFIGGGPDAGASILEGKPAAQSVNAAATSGPLYIMFTRALALTGRTLRAIKAALFGESGEVMPATMPGHA